MRRILFLSLLMAGLQVPDARSQDLELNDRDLQRFEDSAGDENENPEDLPDVSPAVGPLSETMSRYDELIDRLKAQVRQVRIELRELPLQAQRARSRLSSMRASEEDLRRRAYERVVFRLPHPVYEDFEEALEEALERQAVRKELIEEIRANERAVERLEEERAELTRDLEQALRLKEEAREAAIGPR